MARHIGELRRYVGVLTVQGWVLVTLFVLILLAQLAQVR